MTPRKDVVMAGICRDCRWSPKSEAYRKRVYCRKLKDSVSAFAQRSCWESPNAVRSATPGGQP